jgi:hypothetical protein
MNFWKFMNKLLVLIATSLLITGCIPIWGNYYRPYSEGAIEKRMDCRDSNGPITKISIEAGTGLITLSASKIESKSDLINIRILFEPNWAWIKDGIFKVRLQQKAEQSTLVIKSNDVAVLLPNAPLKINPTLTAVTSYSRLSYPTILQLPLLPNLELMARKYNGSQNPEMYWLDYEFKLGELNQFTLVIPEFIVDGTLYKSRTGQFVNDWDIWISPINGC